LHYADEHIACQPAPQPLSLVPRDTADPDTCRMSELMLKIGAAVHNLKLRVPTSGVQV